MEKASDSIRLNAEDLDQIRATVDWQALFHGLRLQKAERRSKPDDWWAFSPFHDEKTPSFHMRPGGVWYDFSVGEGGGPIELVQRLEGGNCFEAGRFILENGWAALPAGASQAGRHSGERAPEPSASPENTPIRQDLRPLLVYHDALAERGLSEETCAELGNGYLGQGRSPLRGRIVFQVADARAPRKSDGALTRVILSHLGRAVSDGQQPKYLFYEGFHKSAELYGQDRLWLEPEAAAQIQATGAILLTEGPMDVAMAHEAGLLNAVASFGSALSDAQAAKLAAMAQQHGVERIVIAYDRDEAGAMGAAKAAERLSDLGLKPEIFDWGQPIGRTASGPAHIPDTIGDLADCTAAQLSWLRGKALL